MAALWDGNVDVMWHSTEVLVYIGIEIGEYDTQSVV